MAGKRGVPMPRRRRSSPEGPVEPRVIRIGDCPWTDAELEARIEEAIRFIAGKKKEHARSFGWEVGEHLLFEVYGGDEAYLRKLDPTKKDSPADIARRTGIPYSTLYVYLMAALARHKLARAGVEPDLDLRHFAVLDGLNEHFEAMCALADWGGRNQVSVKSLERAVDRWKEHIEEGGSLEDLRKDPGVTPKR
jgi:hypothetical protein